MVDDPSDECESQDEITKAVPSIYINEILVSQLENTFDKNSTH